MGVTYRVGREAQITESQKLENSKIFYRYLTSEMGIASRPALAMIGCWYTESAMNPGCIESNGVGYGLVQWTPHSKLTNYANARHMKWYDYKCQLQLLRDEANGQSSVEWYPVNHRLESIYHNTLKSRPKSYTFKAFAHDKTHSLQYLIDSYIFCYLRCAYSYNGNLILPNKRKNAYNYAVKVSKNVNKNDVIDYGNDIPYNSTSENGLQGSTTASASADMSRYYQGGKTGKKKVLITYSLSDKTCAQLCTDIVRGKFGNGKTRKTKLISLGYDYNKLQKLVNKMLQRK